jgi:hypothetical protein
VTATGVLYSSLTGSGNAIQVGASLFVVAGTGFLTCQGINSNNDVTVNGSVACSNWLQSANGFRIGSTVIIDNGGTLQNCNVNTSGYITCAQPVSAASYKIAGAPIIDANGNFNNTGMGASNSIIAGTTNLSTTYATAFYATQYYRRSSNTVLVDANGVYYAYGSISGISSGPGSGTGNWSGYTGYLYATNPSPDTRLMRFLNGLLIGIQ